MPSNRTWVGGEDRPELNMRRKVGGLRISYANFGGIGKVGSEKDFRLQQWFRHTQADIIGLAEVNTNWWWRGTQSLHERANNWIKCQGETRNVFHSVCAHNESDLEASSYQIGGVALVLKGQTVNRVMDWEKTNWGLAGGFG